MGRWHASVCTCTCASWRLFCSRSACAYPCPYRRRLLRPGSSSSSSAPLFRAATSASRTCTCPAHCRATAILRSTASLHLWPGSPAHHVWSRRVGVRTGALKHASSIRCWRATPQKWRRWIFRERWQREGSSSRGEPLCECGHVLQRPSCSSSAGSLRPICIAPGTVCWGCPYRRGGGCIPGTCL